MPYVRRSADGRIQSLHRQPEDQAAEFIADGDAALVEFIGGAAPAPVEDFGRLDADFVRVIEDVIDTLITKNILNITDLPAEAQAKLFARKGFRDRVSKSSLRLFDTDGADTVI